jgi:hypothetical protein
MDGPRQHGDGGFGTTYLNASGFLPDLTRTELAGREGA